jgi:hypothetical protein
VANAPDDSAQITRRDYAVQGKPFDSRRFAALAQGKVGLVSKRDAKSRSDLRGSALVECNSFLSLAKLWERIASATSFVRWLAQAG